MTQIGSAEVLVIIGVLLVGAAVWLWAGVAAVLAYAGTVAIVLGLGLAWREFAVRQAAKRAE